MTELEQKVVDFLKTVEGFRSEAYLDSAGVITIGYGTTKKYPYISGNGQPMGLFDLQMGDTCTFEQAEKYLFYYLNRDIFPKVLTQTRFYNIADDGIYTALCSFYYNEGIKPALFIGSCLNDVASRNESQESLLDLANEFRKYNKIRDKNGNFVVCPGLVNRREKEIALFLKNGE